jgi:hypothetical protein
LYLDLHTASSHFSKICPQNSSLVEIKQK